MSAMFCVGLFDKLPRLRFLTPEPRKKYRQREYGASGHKVQRFRRRQSTVARRSRKAIDHATAQWAKKLKRQRIQRYGRVLPSEVPTFGEPVCFYGLDDKDWLGRVVSVQLCNCNSFVSAWVIFDRTSVRRRRCWSITLPCKHGWDWLPIPIERTIGWPQ